MGKRAIIITVAIIGVILFGYTQYAMAHQINVVITDSELIQKTEQGSLYNLELEFKNPSLLLLNAGKTEFTIDADNNFLGGGELDPFILHALGKATTSGTFLKEQSANSENPQVKISGVTKYQLLFASLDVPFTYYPTTDQTRGFIEDA